ncbi:2450_t:CDS:1, partial [Acaulospora colombiana]
ESGIPNVVKKVTLDEKSALRKKQRTFSPSAGDVSSSDSKPSMWATRTFPFHRARSGSDPTRKRLGMPSFGWPKPVAASTLSPMTSDSTMEDSDGDSDHILVPSPSRRRTGLMTIAENSDDNSSAVSSTLRTHRHPVSSDAENPREVPLRCQPTATKSQSTWKPMPKPPVRLSRKKLPSPPLSEVSPPPRLSSPLGPERHLLPPRPRFPRSMNSRSSSELRFGKDGMRIPSLGERGAAADMYRRVLLRSAHFAARKRELARLAKIAAQANPEEVYVLRLSDDVKGGVVVVAESTKHKQEKLDNRMDIVEKQEEEEQSEKMDVDTPECGDIELLPDIPDMDFEEDHKMVSASPC